MSSHNGRKKIIVILGPTASGKSDLAVKLARRFSGEIISADSRQIYKDLNIGSGKITKKEMHGISHHLLDVASPRRKFTAAQYQKLALRAVAQIQRRGKLPFLVGGTGFYIQSVIDGTVFPNVPPNRTLRARLAKKSADQLFEILKKIDPIRAADIDAKNPHRLIRAIEIVKVTGHPIPKLVRSRVSYQSEILQIGMKKSSTELKRLIGVRLQRRIKKIVAEVKNLHQKGLSWKRLEELGLEYRFTAQYLQGKISLPQTIKNIQMESEHFAKRQMTWFKRDSKIHWIKNQQQAGKLVQKFINQKPL